MIYQVNVQRIDKQMDYLERCRSVLDQPDVALKPMAQQFAVARAIHIAAECIIEVGSVLIDGFIMRDPGGYVDIIDILEDQQVITTQVACELKDLMRLREKLVRFYDEITEEDLVGYVKQNQVFQLFKEQVYFFIADELNRQSGRIEGDT